MNPIIKQQLNRVKRVTLPEWDEDTAEMIIPKQSIKELFFQEGHCYIIEMAPYILNPPEGFSLHINWNNNVIPKSACMQVRCLQIMGKMIKVHGCGFDFENKTALNDFWQGWLPAKSVTILKEIGGGK